MSLNQKTKSALSLLFRFGLSGALLIYIFSKIDLQKTAEALKTADLKYIFIAIVIFWGMNGILFFRWRLFIKALELSTTMKNAILHYFYGFFGNLFMPTAIGGDVIKTVGLCRGSNEKPKVVASVILDRISGFYAIILVEISALLLGFSYVLKDQTLLMGIITLGVAAIVMTIVLFNEKIYTFVFKLFNWFPKIKKAFMSLHYDIALLKQGDKINAAYKGVAIATLSQIIYCFIWFLVSKALHQEVPFINFIVFVPLLSLASSFPSIGGLGVREAAAVYLFSKIGMDAGVAVSLSLINFLFMVMIGVVGGILYVYTLSTRRVQHYSSNVSAEPREA